jgi:hypothetical protein
MDFMLKVDAILSIVCFAISAAGVAQRLTKVNNLWFIR